MPHGEDNLRSMASYARRRARIARFRQGRATQRRPRRTQPRWTGRATRRGRTCRPLRPVCGIGLSGTGALPYHSSLLPLPGRSTCRGGSGSGECGSARRRGWRTCPPKPQYTTTLNPAASRRCRAPLPSNPHSRCVGSAAWGRVPAWNALSARPACAVYRFQGPIRGAAVPCSGWRRTCPTTERSNAPRTPVPRTKSAKQRAVPASFSPEALPHYPRGRVLGVIRSTKLRWFRRHV
jgi:hypothetical protein